MEAAEQVLLRRPEVMRRVGLKTTSLYRKMAIGDFPKPVKLGSGAAGVAWVEREIDAWIAARVAERDAGAA